MGGKRYLIVESRGQGTEEGVLYHGAIIALFHHIMYALQIATMMMWWLTIMMMMADDDDG